MQGTLCNSKSNFTMNRTTIHITLSLVLAMSVCALAEIKAEDPPKIEKQNLFSVSEVPGYGAPEGDPGHASSKMSRALNLYCLRAFKKPTFLPMGDQNDIWTRDFLTGEWGGVRTWLWDHGVELVFAYIVDAFNNIGGRNDAFFAANPDGPKNGTSTFSIGIGSIDLFTGPMGLWDGGFIHLTTAVTSGSSISYEYVGSLNPGYYYNNAFADYYKVFEFFYEQKFDQNKIAVRVGQIYPYVLVGACPVSCNLLNGSFHYPTFIGSSFNGEYGNGLGPGFIAATVGVQVRYTPNRRWMFIAHVMDGYADPSGGYFINNSHGINPSLGGGEGSEIILQASYKANQIKGDPGLPGTFTAGTQIHTGTFAHKYENDQGRPRITHGGNPKLIDGNYELYFIGEQTLWQTGGKSKSISAFSKVTLAPENINLISFQSAWGISYKGLIPERKLDALTLGYSYSRFSDDFRRSMLEIGSDAVYESVVELSYTASVTPWLLLRPTMQWVHNPFGLQVGEDPFVLGLSTRVSF
jgi:porin